MRLSVVAMCLWPVVAGAEDMVWTAMSGAAVKAVLSGCEEQYDLAWPAFRASGSTVYHAGRDSWGYWRVEDDQYCSLWPRFDPWTCHAVQRSGDRLRFIGAGGHVTEATYAD